MTRLTVVAAAGSRVLLAREVPRASASPVGAAMMLGGMLRAASALVLAFGVPVKWP